MIDMINKKIIIIFGMILLVAGVTYAAGVVLFGGNSHQDITDGLVLSMNLSQADYTSGTKTFTDDSSSKNNGVSANAATFTTDNYGRSTGATKFNGASDYINIQSSNSLNISNEITIGAWVYGNSWNDVDRKAVVIKGYSYYLTIVPAGYVAVYAYGKSPPGYNLSNGILPLGVWNYITMTVNSSGFGIYINGILDRFIPATGTINLSSSALSIGSEFSGTSRYFNGSIAQVQIWNRALSSSEVQAVYNASKPKMSSGSTGSGLVGYWPLDGDDYNSVTGRVSDKTPYSNHGTNSGATLTTDRMGQSNGSMSFNGTNNYIKLPEPPALSTNISTGSVFAWIKTSNAGTSYRGIVVKQLAYGMFFLDNIFVIYDWGNSASRTTSINLADGQWHYIGFTFQNINDTSPSNNANLYIDGVFNVTRTLKLSSQSEGVVFGAGDNPGSTQFFNGSIADVRIYNRTLSATEIKTLYDSYKPKESAGTLQKGLTLDMPLTSKYTSGNVAGSEIIKDKTPYSNSGQNYGATVGSDSASFDGLNDYINISDNSLISGRSALTIAYWLKPNGNTTHSAPIFLTKGNSDTIRIYNNIMMLRNAGNSWYGSGTTVSGTTTLGIGTWYNLAFVFNGTNRMVYVNGVLDGTSSPATSGAVYSSSNNIYVGYSDYPAGTDYLNSSVSGLKIYNRALSTDEIKLLYDKGR